MGKVEALFYTPEFDQLARAIESELANRNCYAYIDYPQLVSDGPSSDKLVTNCNAFHSAILKIILKPGTLEEFVGTSEKPEWLRSALFFGEDEDGSVNVERVARGIGAGLVQRQGLDIDDHVDRLGDDRLVRELGLKLVDETNVLVDLSDERLELRNHGLIFDSHTLIYPHQFLRRFYGSNFVGLPHLLNLAKESGVSVGLRVDPLRRTTVDHYREIFERDYWYGQPFSEALLRDKHLKERTVHRSKCATCLSDYCEIFTVFRTDMMEKNKRQFKIEEYCSLEARHGVGERFCIEKFGHVVYDQNEDYFTHLDGAVRVFPIEEYIDHLAAVESGRDVDEKIGTRHKLFLTEGVLDRELVKELLTEWFRYNPHLGEYFGGKVEQSLGI